MSPRRRLILTLLSFALPLAVWSVISYVPWLWHPYVHVTDPGGVDYFIAGMDVERDVFAQEAANAVKAGLKPPQGYDICSLIMQSGRHET